MEKNKKIALISILIAIAALLIIILILSILIMNQKAKKASVENIIDPFATGGSSYGGSSVNVYNGVREDDTDDDDDDDVTPPNSASNLRTTGIGADFITWEWDNPSNSDFSRTLIYMNGVYVTSTSSEIYNATGLLENTTYTITLHTRDTSGNVNNTNVSDTQTTGTVINSPIVSGMPDISFPEDGSHNSLDLDDYVTDADHNDSELTWTYSGNTNVFISINSNNVVTFTSVLNWYGSETITFRATDPDSNFGEDTITVTVTPVDDPTTWLSLSSRTINEDSSSGTVVYNNILSRINDPDSNITLTIGTNVHFTVQLNGNNLVVSNLVKNWHGSETVVLQANGVPATFTLTVRHLLDDCEKICSWGTCYELCD